MFRDVVMPVAIALIVLVVIICGFMCISQIINIKYIDNVQIEVIVDGEIVYSGASAGCSMKSTGSSTQVNVMGGFLYLFPRAYYVSEDVKVVNL